MQLIAEVTLALLLFSDASRIDLRQLWREAFIPGRLLVIGLPLTLILGTASALVMFADLPWSLALFVGAALAPTDAALSAAVVNNPRVPLRLRRSLNVESGLNDGGAAPVVTIALALAVVDLGLVGETESVALTEVFRELGLGLMAGLVVGAVGALAMNTASARQWSTTGARRIAALALAAGAYSLALAVHGNGFISAFVAGITFGALLDKGQVDAEGVVELPELGGELLVLVVWFLVGAGLLPIVGSAFSVSLLAFAVLSLTVFRMLPVAISMAGSHLPGREVLFLGWFGPRGLASVVFALLAVEELAEAEQPLVSHAVGLVVLTVLLSVIAHGVTAGPAGKRFGPNHADAGSGGRDRQPIARPQTLEPGPGMDS